jgi:hypothetical protein
MDTIGAAAPMIDDDRPGVTRETSFHHAIQIGPTLVLLW